MSPDAFRTGGVDLASQDNHTALAEIAWYGGTATLESLRVGVGNDDIVAAAQHVEVLGIDCPLGWPSAFVEFLLASRAGSVPADAAATAADKQRLAFRDTDLRVRQAVGRWPLSVAADRIAYPAMRCAGLLARLSADGHPVRRSGIGSRVAEVYPAGALLRWRAGRAGKKTDSAGLDALVDELMRRTPWLDWAGRDPGCRANHDAFDAVVCALVAGAVVLERTVTPTDLVLADEEGWIHLPDAGFLEQGPAPAS